VPGLFGEQGHGVLEPGAVLGDRYAHRIAGVGVFGGGVDEVAAAEARGAGDLADQFEQGGGALLRVRLVERFRDGRAQVRVGGAQVRLDEVFLRGEVPVEGRPGHTGLRDEAAHRDGVDALAVEQPARGLQQAFPGVRSGGHALSVETERSVDTFPSRP